MHVVVAWSPDRATSRMTVGRPSHNKRSGGRHTTELSQAIVMPGPLFAEELAHYGPDHRQASAPSLADSRAYCRELARRHYENFSVASMLLPRGLRPHFHAVYAYCRWADDLADEVGDP